MYSAYFEEISLVARRTALWHVRPSHIGFLIVEPHDWSLQIVEY
jgi:hypothetical protein